MQLGIGMHFSSSKLRFGPCYGRRTIYATIQIGSRHLFLQRWDTERQRKNRWLTRDGRMGWTAGYWYVREYPLRTFRKSFLPWSKAEVR